MQTCKIERVERVERMQTCEIESYPSQHVIVRQVIEQDLLCKILLPLILGIRKITLAPSRGQAILNKDA